MTHRHRPAPGVALPAPPGSAGEPRPHAAEPAPSPSWEEVFRGATPAQREQLLTLARRQGLLYAHQFAAPTNGAAHDPARVTLNRLLHGPRADLSAFLVRTPVLIDTALDEAQSLAVARALHTPDVCVIAGLPGSGKSRVAAEIVLQAADRGERVLLAGYWPRSVDRVLEQIGGHETVCALRCFDADESVEAMPPAVQALTFSARWQRWNTGARAPAAREVQEWEQRCRCRRDEEPVWDRLREIRDRWDAAGARLEEVRRQRDRVPAEVEREAAEVDSTPPQTACTPFISRLSANVQNARGLLEEIREDREQLDRQRQEKDKEWRSLDSRLDALRPAAEAKRLGHWWSGAWWKASFQGQVVQQFADLEEQHRQAKAAITALDRDMAQLKDKEAQTVQARDEERGRLVRKETDRRQRELDEQLTRFRAEQDQCAAQFRAEADVLDTNAPRPAGPARDDYDRAREQWLQGRKEEEAELNLARRWAEYVGHCDGRSPPFLQYVNVVAGTPAALARDAYFGSGAKPPVTFDLLVVQGAEQLTETEFLSLAHRARRWVLIGEVRDTPAGKGAARSAPVPGFFQRLWQPLYGELRTPYRWTMDDGRLSCRLQPVPPELRSSVETERLADFPEIELTIFTPHGRRPVLAEVAFPASFTVEQAKQFLFRELEELTVQPAHPWLSWTEEGDRIVAEMGPVTSTAVAVELLAGVREVVVESPAPAEALGGLNGRVPDAGDSPADRAYFTGRLEFEWACGWTHAKAEEWVRGQLGFADAGRAVRLHVPYRMNRRLAEQVAGLLYPGKFALPASANGSTDDPAGDGCGFEFVPVPAPERGDGRKKAAPVVPSRSARGGAGLEIDLVDNRQRDRLPADLAGGLPSRGLVNYYEARAVVAKVQELLREHPSAGAEPPSVAVIGLYPAQAALIRALLRKSGTANAVVVDCPAGLREQEFDLVLVSLTRSHTHRAVSYGEHQSHLELALTRARKRLILFGDVGSLARRGQWNGPLDHLDEAAAGSEREVIARLVEHLRGSPSPPALVAIGEGTGP